MAIRKNSARFALHSATSWLSFLALTGCGLEPTSSAEETALESGRQELSLPPGLVLEPIRPIRPICGLHISALPAKFAFDGGTSESWETRGMFDGDSSTVLSAYGSAPAPFWDRTNAFAALGTDPVDGHGSVVAPLQGGAPLTASDWMRFDFRSPDVSGVLGWQGKTSFRYSLLEAAWYGVYAQLALEVEKCDGSTAFVRELNAAGQPVFCALTHGAWTTCTTNITFSNVDHVKRLHVRVFGPEGTLFEGGIYLDEVRAL